MFFQSLLHAFVGLAFISLLVFPANATFLRLLCCFSSLSDSSDYSIFHSSTGSYPSLAGNCFQPIILLYAFVTGAQSSVVWPH